MQKINFKLLSFLLISTALFASFSNVYGIIRIPNPLKAENFAQLIDMIINFIYSLALWITPIMYIIGGFFYVTAAGDPEKINTGKKIFLYTTLGFLIIISAKGLINLFKEVFTTSPQNQTT